MDEEEGKDHAPSQRKLDQARERGEVARSQDLLTACSFAGFLLGLYAVGPTGMIASGTAARRFLADPAGLAAAVAQGGTAVLAGAIGRMVFPLLPLVTLPAVAVVTGLLVQRSFLITPERLAPKLSRISPFATAAQKFGPAGLVDFAKNLTKLVLTGLLLAVFLARNAARILASAHLTASLAVAELLRLVTEFLILVALIAAVIGGLDYLWQGFQHIRRNRMSRQEMVEEHKDAEGDPHAKAERRQRGVEIATNRMLRDVAKADVIIVNPTHYAVALKWDRKARRAPLCVAKGMDEIATRIRQLAAEAGIPIHSDPPTARALHAGVEIGSEIRPEHYRAVAAAIRFAEAMRKRARSRA